MRHVPIRPGMRTSLLALAASAMPTSAFQQYPRGVKGVTTVEYYEVRGRTAAELAADLRRLGPRDEVGRARAGVASSPLQWSYAKIARGLGCVAADVVVTLHTRIVLPRWVPPVDSEPGLLAKWNLSMAALAVHEEGHKEVSVRYAKRIRDGIADLRAPCRTFTAMADSASRRQIDAMREAQAAYDAETKHGLTQGTGFPPPPVPQPEGPPATVVPARRDTGPFPRPG